MLSKILILFLSSFVAGLAVMAKPTIDKINFKFILAFSGAFLFSSTIIHLLPESFELSNNISITGGLVLLGFYFQMFVEFFSEGVEHGHIHIHKPHQLRSISIIIALSIHALIEGMVIMHGENEFHKHDSNSLLLGLVIHKIPETIALVAVLISNEIKKSKVFIVLLLFASASPVGAIISSYFAIEFINFSGFVMALVAGNFLYISTTIFFESNPDHKAQPMRILALLLGGVSSFVFQLFI